MLHRIPLLLPHIIDFISYATAYVYLLVDLTCTFSCIYRCKLRDPLPFIFDT